MILSSERRWPIAPSKTRAKQWDITRVSYRLRGQVDRSRVAADHLRAGHQSNDRLVCQRHPFCRIGPRARREIGSRGYNPLFEVRFALQNHPMPEVSLPNLSARLSMRSTGTARFQLGCEITEDREGLEIAWLFRENLFSRRDIESLDGIFQTSSGGHLPLAGEPNL